MRRAAILIAILILTLAFVGCREITTDLHDIYTITFFPGSDAAVDGEKSLITQTDVHGRVTKLPAPQRGKWTFTCPGVDQSGRSHQTGYVAGICETLFGCTLGSWSFAPDPNAPAFKGWQTGGGTWITETSVFEADTPLFAKWQSEESPPAEGSVAKQIADLQARSGTPLTATINVNANETIDPQLLSFRNRPITITLKGIRPMISPWCCVRDNCSCTMTSHENSEPCTCSGLNGFPCPGPSPSGSYATLTLNDSWAMFTVASNVTLILEDVQLFGYIRNNEAVIVIEEGAKVIMKDNVKIAYNRADSTRHGGGVTVNKGGILEMEGGMFFQNTTRNLRTGNYLNLDIGGGAVWVRGGQFTMSGGRMEQNGCWGGGGTVRVSHGGTFDMIPSPKTVRDPNTGAVIGENYDPVMYENWAWSGGAVFVSGGEDAKVSTSYFNMRGGSIDYNYTPLWGGGVCVAQMGHFNMYGGDIIDNEAGEGGGIDNEGIVMIRGEDAWIWLNTSLAGRTGGLSNWNIVEMWDGLIGINEGGYGGGIRNFGDFTLMNGDIVGNIANGGPGGGMFNLGHFFMHGGNICYNAALVSQGGGVFHGTSGSPEGKFTLTDGFIWDNRDLTHYYVDGLPGYYGNIRLNTSERSFNLARPGYFHLDPAGENGWTGGDRTWPNDGSRLAGWTRITNRAPVFEDCDPDENIGDRNNPVYPTPVKSQNIYWFIPPRPTAAGSFMADGSYRGVYMRFTVGRPRIEVRTPSNPSSSPRLVMDRSVTAVDTAALSTNPTAWPSSPPQTQAGVPRGGSYFPYRLATVHTAEGASIAGYAWIVRNGHLQAMTLEWVTIGNGANDNLGVLANWPLTPALGFLDFYSWIDGYRPLTPAQAWPWNVSTLPPLGNTTPPSQDTEPPATQVSGALALDQAILNRLQGRDQKTINRIMGKLNRSVGVTEWPVPAIELQIEQRQQKYIEPRLEKRFFELMERLDGGEGGGGPTPL